VNRRALIFGVTAAPLLAFAAPAAAQTFTVTNLGNGGVPGDGSLRGEVAAANAAKGPDTVTFAPGLTGTITFGGTGIVIEDPVDVEGPGPAQVTIQQTVAHRVFEVEAIGGAAVKIAGLHLADGIAPAGGAHPGKGGDIFNAGATLTLEDDLITGGEAENGGGVYSFEAPLTLRSSTVSDNSAIDEGGVSAGGGGSWSIVASTISGNEAAEFDGGLGGGGFGAAEGLIEASTISGNTAGEGTGGASLSAAFGGFIQVRNSTISGNTAGKGPGGLFAFPVPFGFIAIEDSTIAGNTVGSGAGGLEFEGEDGGLTLTDTIVSDNTSGSGSDLMTHDGSLQAAFSLFGDATGATFIETAPASNLVGVSARLEPLRDNGGPTETMALAPNSPAVNKGGGSLNADQRGDVRPVVYPGIAFSGAPGATGADIGAYELQAPPVEPPPPPPRSALPLSPPTSTGPRVRVSCPQSAKPGGCRFALQVVSGKPKRVKGKLRKPKPESAVARVKLAAGHNALLTLKPKVKFAARLEAAAKVLVREMSTVKGSTHNGYRRLKVVG
jgi:hypothetical protein